MTRGCHFTHQPISFARQRIDDGLDDDFGWKDCSQRARHITERLQDRRASALRINVPLSGLSYRGCCNLLLT